MNEDKIVVFQSKKIRRSWHEEEWYFSVVDVVEALTDSPSPRKYWVKIKDRAFKALELSPIWRQLKLESADGKFYNTDCANTESIFRIIQSIPSKKAEPFKRWLAMVGYQRVQEIERENLRDHMDDMELILTMLGEASTTLLTRARDSKKQGKVSRKKDTLKERKRTSKTRE